MNKKSFIIGLIILFIVLLILVPIAVINTKDLIEEKKLYEEIDSIIILINKDTIDIETLDKKTSNYITKGNFLKVEKASKNYLNAIGHTFNDAYILLEDKKISKLLSIDNYKNDGKEFNDTLSYLDKLKSNVKTTKAKINDLFDSNKRMEYINAYNLDSYYTNLYKKLVIKDNLKFNKNLDKFDKLVTDIENLIIFLKNNSEDWIIQDDKIAFKTNELIDEYNKLLDKID